MLHGDIKPANILIKGDIFKLCDFGTTLVLDENKQCNFDDYTTTEPFMPPEGKCSIFESENQTRSFTGPLNLNGHPTTLPYSLSYELAEKCQAY